MPQLTVESPPSPCRFRRHQHLARPGETLDAIYTIEEGWAARYTMLGAGRRQITALFLPGDYCEPQWMVRPRCSEPVIALTRVSATRMPIGGAQMDAKLLIATLGVIERQSAWIVSLGRKSAIERIGTVIAELLGRLETAGEANQTQFHMPLTQADLADIVGLTPIHVNRVMKNLKTRGIIAASKQTITVKDRAALQTLARGGQVDRTASTQAAIRLA